MQDLFGKTFTFLLHLLQWNVIKSICLSIYKFFKSHKNILSTALFAMLCSGIVYLVDKFALPLRLALILSSVSSLLFYGYLYFTDRPVPVLSPLEEARELLRKIWKKRIEDIIKMTPYPGRNDLYAKMGSYATIDDPIKIVENVEHCTNICLKQYASKYGIIGCDGKLTNNIVETGEEKIDIKHFKSVLCEYTNRFDDKHITYYTIIKRVERMLQYYLRSNKSIEHKELAKIRRHVDFISTTNCSDFANKKQIVEEDMILANYCYLISEKERTNELICLYSISDYYEYIEKEELQIKSAENTKKFVSIQEAKKLLRYMWQEQQVNNIDFMNQLSDCKQDPNSLLHLMLTDIADCTKACLTEYASKYGIRGCDGKLIYNIVETGEEKIDINKFKSVLYEYTERCNKAYDRSKNLYLLCGLLLRTTKDLREKVDSMNFVGDKRTVEEDFIHEYTSKTFKTIEDYENDVSYNV